MNQVYYTARQIHIEPFYSKKGFKSHDIYSKDISEMLTSM